MARVLITDGEQRSSLATVRSLGAAGHEVHVCSVAARPLAAASRYCVSSERTPDPHLDPEAYAGAVAGLLERGSIDVLIPMTDVSALVLLDLGDSRPDLRVPFPARSAYEAISDKRHAAEVAADLGIPVPEQIVLESAAVDAAAGCRTLGFPMVLKPARSVVRGADGIRKFSVTVVPRKEDLQAAIAAYPADAYPILAQRHVRGPGLGVFALFWDGVLVATFAHRRLREKPPTGGVSVYRESVPVREELRDQSERLLSHFSWRGVAMVEFKEDAATGTCYLMEVNGRFWGSLQLAIDAGVDFPRLLVGLAMGEPIDPVPSYDLSVRSRWLWGDFDHLLWLLRAPARYRLADPSLPGRVGGLSRFLVPWRPGDHFEVLRVGDPGPFLRESINWFRSLLA